MFYHAIIRREGRDNYWLNMSKEQMAEALLMPFVRGQVTDVTMGGRPYLINWRSVDRLRIVKTEYELDEKKKVERGKMKDDDFLDKNDCTRELIQEVRKIQAPPGLTSLLQMAFAPQQEQVFVIMKFGDKRLDSAYEGVVKAVAAEFSLKSLRIDEVQDSGKITDQVLQNIAVSRVVLADLSGERPNCYYETGFAHALGKDIILTIQKGDQIHFDLASHRFILWETEAELRQSLRERFAAILR